MRILTNEDLSKYTTVRIGGTAKRMLIPKSTDELIDIINSEHPQYFIGGGSNLLINNREFDLVVSLKEFDKTINHLGDGLYQVGASVYLSTLINKINNDGYGGIEYLCNVPGLIGGAVAMNAGTGKKTNHSISDFITSVTVIKNGVPEVFSKKECEFSHRNSIFKRTPGLIVTSVGLSFPEKSVSVTAAAKKEKLTYYKEKQDPSYPNFGSVFSQSSHKIMVLAKKMKIGKRIHFSGKTANWMINENHGTFNEAISAIRIVELLHRITGKKCIREVVVWE